MSIFGILWRFLLLCMCVLLEMRNCQESKGEPHPNFNNMTGRCGENSSIYMAQIIQRLGMIETETQRHTARLQEFSQTMSRVEFQRQEIISMLDRAEARLSQRLEDIKGSIHKVVALQDVLREDMEKIRQDQLFAKIWIEEQIRQISEEKTKGDKTVVIEQSPIYSPDVSASLQVLQTTLNNLRKQVFVVQTTLAGIQANITDINNTTISLHQKSEEMVTKQYITGNLREQLENIIQTPVFCSGGPASMQPIDEDFPRDCQSILESGQNQSGVYRIKPLYLNHIIFVYCDMETEGGGWTVFQRRQDGSVDFLREWQDYKYGFGNIGGEHWIGNEYLHLITQQDLYELRIELKDFEDGETYAKYDAFVIGNEKQKYMIKVLGPVSGDAGDGMSYHASMAFSTIDADNDRWIGGDCAKSHTGGWWYNQCDASNLNGQYLGGPTSQEYKGIYWHEWHGPNYSLRFTEMKIRPRNRQTWVNDKNGEGTTPSNGNDEEDDE